MYFVNRTGDQDEGKRTWVKELSLVTHSSFVQGFLIIYLNAEKYLSNARKRPPVLFKFTIVRSAIWWPTRKQEDLCFIARYT